MHFKDKILTLKKKKNNKQMNYSFYPREAIKL